MSAPVDPVLPNVAPGRVVGERYRVLHVLGAGGMGVVARARDLRLGRDVALKLLQPGAVGDTQGRARLLREAHAMAAFSHPCVVHVYDAGETDDGGAFLAMELVEGETIRRKLHGEWPVEARLAALVDVARALAAAHGAGLVHRDVKPENLMVRADGRAVLLDFGIVRIAPAPHATEAGALTGPDATIGTLAYMSPEQARASEIDGSTDQFSLAVTAFEVLTGTYPWPSETIAAQIEGLLALPAPPLSSRAPALVALDAVLGRAMAKAPAERYPSMTAFADALEAATAHVSLREPAALARVPAPDVSTDPLAKTEAVSTPLASDAELARTEAVPTPPAAAPPVSAVSVERSTGLRSKRGRWLIAGGVALALALAGFGGWRARRAATAAAAARDAIDVGAPGVAGRAARRRSVAVLGFANLAGRADSAWLSTALRELFWGELAAVPSLRAVAFEDVARARRNLDLAPGGDLSPPVRERLRAQLGADALLLGSYRKDGAAIHLDLRLIDARGGAELDAFTFDAKEDDLAAAGGRVGERLRTALGVPAPTTTLAALPTGPEAARAYAEGLDQLLSDNPASARTLLERAVALAPEHPAPHSALASTLEALRLQPACAAEAKRAFELSRAWPREQALLLETLHLIASGDTAGAADRARALTELFPDEPRYHTVLAAELAALGRRDDALGVLARGRELSPEDPSFDLLESWIRMNLEDTVGLRDACERAARKAKAIGARSEEAQANDRREREATDSAPWANLRVCPLQSGGRTGLGNPRDFVGRNERPTRVPREGFSATQ